MTVKYFVYVGLFLQCVFCIMCDAHEIDDVGYLEFSELVIYYNNKDRLYINKLEESSVESGNYELMMKSKSPIFIQEFVYSLGAENMKMCSRRLDIKDRPVHLMIIVKSHYREFRFLSDGKILWDKNKNNCMKVSEDYLLRFDLRGDWLKKREGK